MTVRNGRQNPTESDTSPEQDLALGALLAGETDDRAAQAAGVTRQTVNSWKNHDAVFIAALNRRRTELWETHRDRLRTLVGVATTALEGALGSADERIRLAAAISILKYGPNELSPDGPCTSQGVQSARIRAILAETR